MSSIEYPDYNDTIEVFGEFAHICNPSYVHGIICGHICFNIPFNAKNWLYGEINKDPEFKNLDKSALDMILNIIVELFDISYGVLQAADFEFDLFLPDDSDELMHRISALSSWCNGFTEVYNLVAQNINLSSEAQEAVDYIKEVINIYTDIDYSEEEAFLKYMSLFD